MNVQLENLPNCITSLRVEVPSDKVSTQWNSIAGEYARQVRLPGYRPGKAPRMVVEAKFKKEIHDEVRTRLISEAVRTAVQENNLRVLSVDEVQDFEFGEDKSASFTASLITEPAFDLPEYKGIALETESAEVTDADVDAALERFRDDAADYSDAPERPAAQDDYAVINYSSTLEGKPLHEVIPAAKQLSEGIDFWVRLTDEAFLPGFSAQLVGAKPNETREFDLEVPADFPLPELAGKTVHYTVTLLSLKDKELPALDDAFAATVIKDKTLEELRTIVRDELGRQKARTIEGKKRNDLVEALLSKVECELPERFVQRETYRILTQLVEENQQRGIPDEVITSNRDQLLASASAGARDRLKSTFLLLRIAGEEKIAITRGEFDRHLQMLAARNNRPVEKLRKEMEKENALERFHEDLLIGKTLDFLVANASVSTKPAAAEAESAPSVENTEAAQTAEAPATEENKEA